MRESMRFEESNKREKPYPISKALLLFTNRIDRTLIACLVKSRFSF